MAPTIRRSAGRDNGAAVGARMAALERRPIAHGRRGLRGLRGGAAAAGALLPAVRRARRGRARAGRGRAAPGRDPVRRPRGLHAPHLEADAEEIHRLLGRYFDLVDGEVRRRARGRQRRQAHRRRDDGGVRRAGRARQRRRALGARGLRDPRGDGDAVGRVRPDARRARRHRERRGRRRVDRQRGARRLHGDRRRGEPRLASRGARGGRRNDRVRRGARGAGRAPRRRVARHDRGARLRAGDEGVARTRAQRRAADAAPDGGRAAERMRVEAALDAARARRGAAFLVRGDPGVGKSLFGESMLPPPRRANARATRRACSTSARRAGATPRACSRARSSASP